MVAEVDRVIAGAISSTVADGLIDVPLKSAGLLYAWEIRDPEGVYVWGMGTGDLIVAGIGAALVYGGQKEFGIGWLLSLGLFKFSELVGYVASKIQTLGYMPRLTQMKAGSLPQRGVYGAGR